MCHAPREDNSQDTKGSAELQPEQISLFCPYLITGPPEGKRDLDAVLKHRLIS